MSANILNYDDYLFPGYSWAGKARRIVKGEVSKTMALDFHKKRPKGAALRKLAEESLYPAYWETKYYKEAISKSLKDMNLENIIVADLGCDDGRITQHLLDLGCHRVMATDIDIVPLKNLADFLERTGNRDKVLLINSTVEKLPLKKDIVDAILCIGVLYYLGDAYESGPKEALRLPKKNGILINSEPDLEGALYKSVFFETIHDVFENFCQRKFKEEKGDTPFKFRLFTEEEMITVLEEHKEVVEYENGKKPKTGISDWRSSTCMRGVQTISQKKRKSSDSRSAG